MATHSGRVMAHRPGRISINTGAAIPPTTDRRRSRPDTIRQVTAHTPAITHTPGTRRPKPLMYPIIITTAA